MECKDCMFWEEDSEYEAMVSCLNEEFGKRIKFSYAECFLISENFGCKYFKNKK